MNKYHITVYSDQGKKLLDETFEAGSDDRAREIGLEKLREKDYDHQPHRVVSPLGNLILFKNSTYQGGTRWNTELRETRSEK